MEGEALVVLITGCTTGIGKELARSFKKRGCVVFATGRRLEAMEDLRKEGIETLTMDVTKDDTITAAVKEITDKTGTIDVLVNNAGLNIVGPVAEAPLDDFRTVMNTNVVGLMSVTQKVAAVMMAQGRGTIVNISSVVSWFSTPFAGPYCASKCAVNALSDALRMELAPFGVKVLVVCPGAIKSEITRYVQHSVECVKKSRFFAPFAAEVEKRGMISQVGCTPTEEFAENTVNYILKSSQPRYFFYGKGAWVTKWVYRWLPQWLTDRILKKKFGLTRTVEAKKEQ